MIKLTDISEIMHNCVTCGLRFTFFKVGIDGRYSITIAWGYMPSNNRSLDLIYREREGYVYKCADLESESPREEFSSVKDVMDYIVYHMTSDEVVA